LSVRPDFPVSDYVAAVQDSVMYEVFSPDVLGRIADQQLRDEHPGASMSEADLFGWMQASVWSDESLKASSIGLLQRDLQRRWTNYLVAISLAPSFILEAIGFPSDTAGALPVAPARRPSGRSTTPFEPRRSDARPLGGPARPGSPRARRERNARGLSAVEPA
jgi:hypothetical protein